MRAFREAHVAAMVGWLEHPLVIQASNKLQSDRARPVLHIEYVDALELGSEDSAGRGLVVY